MLRKIGDILSLSKRTGFIKILPNSLKPLMNPPNMILSAYIMVQFTLLLSHEPWRDEVSPWIQTLDSSWAEIVYRSQLELQSPFFFSVLKLIHFLTDDFLAYRLFLFFLTIGSAFIIKVLCNNSWRLLILLYSNYYLVYEYSTIQRIYAVSLFSLLVFLYCLRKDMSSGRLISSSTKISLLMLSFVSIWTLLLSVVILVTLISCKTIPFISRFIAVFLTSTVTQLLFLLLSKDRDWGLGGIHSRGLVNFDNVLLIFTAPIRSLIFIPEFTIFGWNTNILSNTPEGLTVTLIMTFLFYGILLLYILEKKYIGIVWFLSISALSILVGLGKQRHLGQIFLLLATIVLLEVYVCKSNNRLLTAKSRVSKGIFLILLLTNVVVSPVAISREISHEFTTSRNLNTHVKEDDLLIIQDSGKNTHLPLVLELNRNVFSVFGASYSRASLLNKSSRSIPNTNELSKKFREVCHSRSPGRILLFTDFETRINFTGFSGRLISRSGSAIVENEGGRELWLLAWTDSDVKRLCSEPHSSDFLSKIRTGAVTYGG